MPITVSGTQVLISNYQIQEVGIYKPIGLLTGAASYPPLLVGPFSPFLVTVNVRTVINLKPGAQDSWVSIQLRTGGSDQNSYTVIDGTQSLVCFLNGHTSIPDYYYQFSEGFSFSLQVNSPSEGNNISLFVAAFGGPFNYVDVHSDDNGKTSMTMYGGVPLGSPFVVSGQRDSNGQSAGTAVPALTSLLSRMSGAGMIIDQTNP